MASPPPPSPLPDLPRLPAEPELRRRVKAELRKRMRGLRQAMPMSSCRERSREIVERVLSLDVVKRAKSVALFFPIVEKREVDLRPLDAALRAQGIQVAYPSIVRGEDPDERTGLMTFHFALAEELEERGFGFAEPKLGTPALESTLRDLDVVVVPALVVDPAGHRIGYGAGYYDRALAMAAVPKVVVAYDYQLVSEVPAMEGDVAVDWIVTDKRVLRAVRAEEMCAPSTGGGVPGAGSETPCRS